MSQRAPKSRPDDVVDEDQDVDEGRPVQADVSVPAVRAMEGRLSDVEDQIDANTRTRKDLVAMVNDLQDTVRELEEKVDDLQ